MGSKPFGPEKPGPAGESRGWNGNAQGRRADSVLYVW